MARVTVEDCVKRIPNRFELVIAASKRTRDLLSGAQITLSKDNDKLPVIALREIAQQTIDVEALQTSLVTPSKMTHEEDEIEDNFKEEILIGREDIIIGDGGLGVGFQAEEATMEELLAEEEGDDDLEEGDEESDEDFVEEEEKA